MAHPLMLLLLITVILTLLSWTDFVSCGANVARTRRTSDRAAEGARPLAWVMDTSDEEEDSEFTSSSTDDNRILIGDMAFQKQDLSNKTQADGKVHYSVVRGSRRIWTNGEMPVKIHRSIRKDVKEIIEIAIEAIVSKTCIRIVPYDKTRHQNYVHIISHKMGCYAYLGQVGNGPQELNLQPIIDCNNKRTILHELMHALGVYHEQQRYDRDNYIDVLEHNLVSDALPEYEKASSEEMTTLGLDYDYGSIMHYSLYQGSKYSRNLPAFRVRGSYDKDLIGMMPHLSQLDIRKLNKLYGCKQTPDNNNNDRPITPRPTQPPAPISDGNTASSCDNVRAGCCVTCTCIGLTCNCKSNCQCHCTCYPLNKRCNCQCNPIVFASGPVIYQSIPQSSM